MDPELFITVNFVKTLNRCLVGYMSLLCALLRDLRLKVPFSFMFIFEKKNTIPLPAGSFTHCLHYVSVLTKHLNCSKQYLWEIFKTVTKYLHLDKRLEEGGKMNRGKVANSVSCQNMLHGWPLWRVCFIDVAVHTCYYRSNRKITAT